MKIKIEKHKDKIIRIYNTITQKPNLSKKSRLINLAFLICGAKIDRLQDNMKKSIVLCVFMTDNTMLLFVFTSSDRIQEKIFHSVRIISVKKFYNRFLCCFISIHWSMPPIRYP